MRMQELFETLSGENLEPHGQVLPSLGSLELERAKLRARYHQLETVMQIISRAQECRGASLQQVASSVALELNWLGGIRPISLTLARSYNLQVRGCLRGRIVHATSILLSSSSPCPTVWHLCAPAPSCKHMHATSADVLIVCWFS